MLQKQIHLCLFYYLKNVQTKLVLIEKYEPWIIT